MNVVFGDLRQITVMLIGYGAACMAFGALLGLVVGPSVVYGIGRLLRVRRPSKGGLHRRQGRERERGQKGF
jgi:membrane protein DedA with SNARE-associated domain